MKAHLLILLLLISFSASAGTGSAGDAVWGALLVIAAVMFLPAVSYLAAFIRKHIRHHHEDPPEEWLEAE